MSRSGFATRARMGRKTHGGPALRKFNLKVAEQRIKPPSPPPSTARTFRPDEAAGPRGKSGVAPIAVLPNCLPVHEQLKTVVCGDRTSALSIFCPSGSSKVFRKKQVCCVFTVCGCQTSCPGSGQALSCKKAQDYDLPLPASVQIGRSTGINVVCLAPPAEFFLRKLFPGSRAT